MPSSSEPRRPSCCVGGLVVPRPTPAPPRPGCGVAVWRDSRIFRCKGVRGRGAEAHPRAPDARGYAGWCRSRSSAISLLPSGAKRVLWLWYALVPVLHPDLTAQWHDRVVVADASEWGWARLRSLLPRTCWRSAGGRTPVGVSAREPSHWPGRPPGEARAGRLRHLPPILYLILPTSFHPYSLGGGKCPPPFGPQRRKASGSPWWGVLSRLRPCCGSVLVVSPGQPMRASICVRGCDRSLGHWMGCQSRITGEGTIWLSAWCDW